MYVCVCVSERDSPCQLYSNKRDFVCLCNKNIFAAPQRLFLPGEIQRSPRASDYRVDGLSSRSSGRLRSAAPLVPPAETHTAPTARSSRGDVFSVIWSCYFSFEQVPGAAARRRRHSGAWRPDRTNGCVDRQHTNTYRKKSIHAFFSFRPQPLSFLSLRPLSVKTSRRLVSLFL